MNYQDAINPEKYINQAKQTLTYTKKTTKRHLLQRHIDFWRTFLPKDHTDYWTTDDFSRHYTEWDKLNVR